MGHNAVANGRIQWFALIVLQCDLYRHLLAHQPRSVGHVRCSDHNWSCLICPVLLKIFLVEPSIHHPSMVIGDRYVRPSFLLCGIMVFQIKSRREIPTNPGIYPNSFQSLCDASSMFTLTLKSHSFCLVKNPNVSWIKSPCFATLYPTKMVITHENCETKSPLKFMIIIITVTIIIITVELLSLNYHY
jgi:hypothetical protein